MKKGGRSVTRKIHPAIRSQPARPPKPAVLLGVPAILSRNKTTVEVELPQSLRMSLSQDARELQLPSRCRAFNSQFLRSGAKIVALSPVVEPCTQITTTCFLTAPTLPSVTNAYSYYSVPLQFGENRTWRRKQMRAARR